MIGFIERKPAAIAIILFLGISIPSLTIADRSASVKFLEPKTPYLSGREKIVLEVELPDGDKLDRLTLFIDGKPAIQTRHPPFRFSHDFGPIGKSHILLAIIYSKNGLTRRAEFRSRAAPLLSRVEVKLVQLNATVTDSRGRFVTTLGPDDFTIRENGVEQKIAFFDHGETPGSIALTLDCSGSMKHRLWRAQKAANDFLKSLPANYEISILGFNDTVFLAQDFTSRKRPLVYAIQQLQASGETALYEAIRAASLHLQGRPDRKAVVLFTDGQESFFRQDETGDEKLREVLETANLAEVTFFAIGYGGNFTSELLSRVSEETGGKFFSSGPKLDLGEVYREIARTLESQYTLAYYSHPPPPPREWRSVEVRVKRADLTVKARKGYFSGK